MMPRIIRFLLIISLQPIVFLRHLHAGPIGHNPSRPFDDPLADADLGVDGLNSNHNIILLQPAEILIGESIYDHDIPRFDSRLHRNPICVAGRYHVLLDDVVGCDHRDDAHVGHQVFKHPPQIQFNNHIQVGQGRDINGHMSQGAQFVVRSLNLLLLQLYPKNVSRHVLGEIPIQDLPHRLAGGPLPGHHQCQDDRISGQQLQGTLCYCRNLGGALGNRQYLHPAAQGNGRKAQTLDSLQPRQGPDCIGPLHAHHQGPSPHCLSYHRSQVLLDGGSSSPVALCQILPRVLRGEVKRKKGERNQGGQQ